MKYKQLAFSAGILLLVGASLSAVFLERSNIWQNIYFALPPLDGKAKIVREERPPDSCLLEMINNAFSSKDLLSLYFYKAKRTNLFDVATLFRSLGWEVVFLKPTFQASKEGYFTNAKVYYFDGYYEVVHSLNSYLEPINKTQDGVFGSYDTARTKKPDFLCVFVTFQNKM